MLVVGIERATKILGLLTTSVKSYAATIRLGQTTSTEDAEGEVLQTVSAEHVTDSQIVDAIAGLRGDILQVPSTVSAIKVAGKRSYQLAREGRPSNCPPGRCASTASSCSRCAGTASSSIWTSRWTARRAPTSGRWPAISAASWGGRALGRPAAHRAGSFSLDQARTLEELHEAPRLSYSIDEACLQSFPRRDLTADEALDASHGRPLVPAGIDGVYAATAGDGRVIALLEDSGPRTSSVVVIRPATL